MKKIILLPILLLLFCSQTQAQTNGSNLVFNGYVRSLVKALDGSTYVGGVFTAVDGITRNHLAKINADGTLNSSFNPNIGGLSNTNIYDLALDPLGNLYIGGSFASVGGVVRNNLAKINADGTLNVSFNPNLNNVVDALTLDPLGNLYVGGLFTTVGGITRNRLAKFNADGSLDGSFDPNMDNDVDALTLDASGNLYVGGGFTSVGGVTRNRLAKFNSDGSLNSSFNPDINTYVFALTIDLTGNLYAGGVFNSVSGVTRNRLVKINADGSINSSYNPNMNAVVYTLTLDPLGDLYVGGDFTTIGGITRSNLAKINADGSLNSSFNPTMGSSVFKIALDSSGNLCAGGFFNKNYAVFNGVSLGNTVFNNDKDSAATYYPNPTTGILNINFSKEISSVSVVNLLGQTVLTQTTSGMAAQLDLSVLTDGTYIVKMVSEGKTQTFKVVKGL